MPLLQKVHKTFFRLKVRHHLPRIPRMYANRFDRAKDVDFDTGRVFARVGVRSPEMVQVLMQRKRVNSVDELIPLLPHRRARARPLARLLRLLQRLYGLSPTEPVLRPALRRLEAEGRALDYEVDPELKARLRKIVEAEREG